MGPYVHLTPLDAAYPSRLRSLADPPSTITVRGGPVEAPIAVAVVGSRKATEDALTFATQLGEALTRAGIVVVSGGALGIDGAAHTAALKHGGRTWAIAGTGHEHCFPHEHASLFERIAEGPGAVVWPFPPGYHARSGFLRRNRMLVGMSDAVVVVQAGARSGALHAASWATRLRKPLWVVPAAPWMAGFEGSRSLLHAGSTPLTGPEPLLQSFGLPAPEGLAKGPVAAPPLPRSLTANEASVVAVLSPAGLAGPPAHTDAIALAAGLTVQAAVASLLTLALENVVVEGPEGFFRRGG